MGDLIAAVNDALHDIAMLRSVIASKEDLTAGDKADIDRTIAALRSIRDAAPSPALTRATIAPGHDDDNCPWKAQVDEADNLSAELAARLQHVAPSPALTRERLSAETLAKMAPLDREYARGWYDGIDAALSTPPPEGLDAPIWDPTISEALALDEVVVWAVRAAAPGSVLEGEAKEAQAFLQRVAARLSKTPPPTEEERA